MIVQTRVDDAIALDLLAARRLGWLAGAGAAIIIVLLAFALWGPMRKYPAPATPAPRERTK